jgi:hypothetical protein
MACVETQVNAVVEDRTDPRPPASGANRGQHAHEGELEESEPDALGSRDELNGKYAAEPTDYDDNTLPVVSVPRGTRRRRRVRVSSGIVIVLRRLEKY